MPASAQALYCSTGNTAGLIMASAAVRPPLRAPVSRPAALMVQCVSKGGKRAVSMAGAATMSRQAVVVRTDDDAAMRTAGTTRHYHDDELLSDSAAADGCARHHPDAAAPQGAVGTYPRYTSAIARSPKIKDLPFKLATPRTAYRQARGAGATGLDVSRSAVAADAIEAATTSDSAEIRRQRRALKRAQAGSLRGFRPQRSPRAAVAYSVRAQGAAAPSSAEFPASVSTLLENLATERLKGRSKLSPKLQSMCCKVIQRFSGKDLQGKSQVAKAVYLAELALMADSTPNMNKLAQDLQRNSGVSYEDLSSAAMNYLRTAANNFKPKSAASFRTYFYTCMRSQMLEAVRTHNPLVLPSRFTKAIKAVSTAQGRLGESLGRDPTPQELAAETKLRPCQVKHVLSHMRSSIVSVEDSGVNDEGVMLHETISSSDDADEELEIDGTYSKFAATSTNEMLQTLMGTLSEKERVVLEHRFGFGASQREPLSANATAKLLGCVRSTVLNTEARALDKLRRLPEFSELEGALLSDITLIGHMEDAL